MGVSSDILPKKNIHWTPALIKRLRGDRTLGEFAALVGATVNTIKRWEQDYGEPDSEHARRLSNLAKRKRFLNGWKLAGSGILIGDLESVSRKLSRDVENTLRERADQSTVL